MRQGIPIVNGHCMRNPFPRVHHQPSNLPGSVQRQNCLISQIERLDLEHIEHYLGYFLAVGFLIERNCVTLWVPSLNIQGCYSGVTFNYL